MKRYWQSLHASAIAPPSKGYWLEGESKSLAGGQFDRLDNDIVLVDVCGFIGKCANSGNLLDDDKDFLKLKIPQTLFRQSNIDFRLEAFRRMMRAARGSRVVLDFVQRVGQPVFEI
jgi:hypothetical protein